MPSDVAPTTIAEVLQRMDTILLDAVETRHRLGYFAALYRRVTRAVRDDIAAGVFDDGVRMERLDVIFANRYLDALAAWQADGVVTNSWQVAFEAAARWRPIVLQHLLVGMNAHILLDLGVAAAQASPGDQLVGSQGDFNRINDLLARLVDQVQAELTEMWPALGWLDRVAGRSEETIINFGMQSARDFAWKVATQLAPLSPEAQEPRIRELDREVAALGRKIVSPGVIGSSVTLAIRLSERGSVERKIGILSETG